MAIKRLWGILAYSAALFAQPQPTFQADVTLVRVPCAVTDAKGGAVRSLGRADFVLFEDGVRQTVKYLWQEVDLPLTVGVVGCCLSAEDQRAVLELFSRHALITRRRPACSAN